MTCTRLISELKPRARTINILCVYVNHIFIWKSSSVCMQGSLTQNVTFDIVDSFSTIFAIFAIFCRSNHLNDCIQASTVYLSMDDLASYCPLNEFLWGYNECPVLNYGTENFHYNKFVNVFYPTMQFSQHPSAIRGTYIAKTRHVK
jgi:hypothetical protein